MLSCLDQVSLLLRPLCRSVLMLAGRVSRPCVASSSPSSTSTSAREPRPMSHTGWDVEQEVNGLFIQALFFRNILISFH